MNKYILTLLSMLSAITIVSAQTEQPAPEAEPSTAEMILQIEAAGIPIVLLIGPAILLLALISIVLIYRDKIFGSGSDEEQVLREDAQEKLENIVEKIKDELEEGQTLQDHHAKEEIDEAEEAVENEEFRRALNIMEQIEKDIGE